MCTYNAEVAARYGKKDHLNSWSVCKLISDLNVNPLNNDSSLMDFPWPVHPFARSLIESLIDYYISVRDLQMAAMLACCFSSFCLNCKRFACSGKSCEIPCRVIEQPHQQDKKLKTSNQSIKNSVSNLDKINSYLIKKLFIINAFFIVMFLIIYLTIKITLNFLLLICF